MKLERARRFIFVANNPSKSIKDVESELITNYQVQYLVIGNEKGENETAHHQGYIEFIHQTTWDQMKKRLFEIYGFNPHIEESKGSGEQNRKYCTKQLDFVEYGSIAIKKSSDDKANAVLQLIMEGIRPSQIGIDYPELSDYIIKHYRSLMDMYKENANYFENYRKIKETERIMNDYQKIADNETAKTVGAMVFGDNLEIVHNK
jgi:hypothetical protein